MEAHTENNSHNSSAITQEALKISSELQVDSIIAKLLVLRGITTPEDAKAFLRPTLREHLPNPSNLEGAEKAIKIILDAVINKRFITIFSDFDVDGITSGTQLWTILAASGARVRYYVPDRIKEGYGLSTYAVEKLAEEKTELLITLDCGITSTPEVTRAKELGMEVIVIDHHELPDLLPPADVIVNPKQTTCGFNGEQLATAGIIWLLGIPLGKALQKALPEQKIPSSKELLDLAALGTICDMVPLRSVNRLIASRGVELIQKNPRIGLQALMEIASIPSGKRFACSHIAFGIGPRLNAAGRIDDASLGFSLLTEKSLGDAKTYAKKINDLNNKRKTLETHVKDTCIDLAEELTETLGATPFGYVLHDESFHVGVIGIAAQRMVESLGKPAAVLGPSEDLEVYKGSVRAVTGFHVANCLKDLSYLLEGHGGHAAAGGFSIKKENIEEFQHAFHDKVVETFPEGVPKKEVRFDLEIDFSEVTIDLVKQIQLLAPFGMGNHSPVFKTTDIEIEHVQVIGENHIKTSLIQNKNVRSAIGWRMFGNPLFLVGNKIDATYSLELNTYKGVTSVQIILKDISAHK